MHRVVHAGTGLTGREALRAIIEDPALELVGVHVSTPAKVGVDAGDLCGMPVTGVMATDKWDEILALAPACVCYCATAVRREPDAVGDFVRLLEAGINVVAISVIPMVYPPTAPPGWFAALQEATQRGRSTFYATGSEPGVLSLNVPTALLACAGRVDSYRMDEYALGLDESYPIWDVLHESMGFGKPDGHVPTRIASGKVSADWETVVRYIADMLGLTLDRVEVDWETELAPDDLPTAVGVIARGTICAHRWQLAGMVDDRPVVAVQYFATVSTTPWPERWPRPEGATTHAALVYRVHGRPQMSMQLTLDPHLPDDGANPGIVATAMAAVNAMPAVIHAPFGVAAQPLSGPTLAPRFNAS
ncbi:dihydrodipicolinate reductase [Mycobacterium sp. 236(2023)]|uniref:dihydrodipicolinate reductase n=1 Tax=Mycobacterium sp. 236(2023) TaxID=3038163 RepID=UPI00241527DE|nr:dihydrodipicolinate reductase [Mycobacterium sp. 236(2023)]MDG4667899.1 dihydrodipicolinate reductase [Mycobacterium sp. 236(2023)]